MATYAQIAADWRLWQEFVDPHGAMDRAEFDATSIEDRMRLIIDAFGPERRPGPKPIPPEARQHVVSVRLRADAAAKFRALGGARWLREAIRKARLPADTDPAS